MDKIPGDILRKIADMLLGNSYTIEYVLAQLGLTHVYDPAQVEEQILYGQCKQCEVWDQLTDGLCEWCSSEEETPF